LLQLPTSTSPPEQAPPFAVAPSAGSLADWILTVPAGPWRPPDAATLGSAAFALVLLEGLLIREVILDGVPAVQLLGPGDVIDPWQAPGASILCGERVSWSAATTARLGVLGERFLQTATQRPSTIVALHRRMAAQLDRAWRHAAIAHLPRVEQRLVAVFCALGDDYGRVSGDGIVIGLRLTHRTLGALVGARRPTVSLALKALGDQGLLRPTPTGWWLSRRATALIDDDSAG
jgi:CRP/FNR family transcriptional regulator, cyclic AMP receptor protein